MKTKLLLLFLITTTSYLQAQIVNIPDINFKTALSWQFPTIDTNGDGEIQLTEAEAFTGTIDVDGDFLVNHTLDRITDLTGIEAFTNLNELLCHNNLLPSLDVSFNTVLTKLNCEDNLLTVIDLSQNTSLADVNCSVNALSTLDLTSNTALITLDCSENQLVNINLNTCIELKFFNCSVNPLSIIDVSTNINIEDLFCSDTNITNIDVSQNILLWRLFVINNQLNSIDVSQNLDLGWLYCHMNQITSIDISQNTVLAAFQCQENKLTFLDARTGYAHFAVFNATANPNLTCVFVDDVAYMEENWGDSIDTESTFVETQTECDALKIDNILSLQDISIFPNPTKGIITLNFNTVTPNTSYQISINNMIGKKLFKSQISNSKSQIEITNLPVGIYFLKIQCKGKILTKKIIKL